MMIVIRVKKDVIKIMTADMSKSGASLPTHGRIYTAYTQNLKHVNTHVAITIACLSCLQHFFILVMSRYLIIYGKYG